jgi:hypothetical protein
LIIKSPGTPRCGAIYLKTKKYRIAIVDLGAALRLDPKDAMVPAYLGEAFEKVGDK